MRLDFVPVVSRIVVLSMGKVTNLRQKIEVIIIIELKPMHTLSFTFSVTEAMV